MSSGAPAEVPGGGDALARERMAAVGYIASLVGHEARNRLATVRAALEIIAAGLEANLSPEYRAMLLQEMDGFIGDFNLGLDMMRCDLVKVEECSVRELVGEAVDAFLPVATRSGIRLATALSQPAARIRTDRRLLRNSLLNLLRNALEALPGTPEARIEVRAAEAPGLLQFEVEDNGPGVPAELREQLFLRLDRGSRGGTGFGLSLCRDAMVLLGGSVRLAPAGGRPGACFQLSVPSGF